MNCNGVENLPGGYRYIFRNNFLRIKDVVSGDEADAWVRNFAKTTNAAWVPLSSCVIKSKEDNKPYIYKRKYKCQHSVKISRRNKYKTCQAKMIVKVLRKNAENIKDFWPCLVEFRGVHNHEVIMLSSKQKHVSQEEIPKDKSSDSKPNASQVGLLEKPYENLASKETLMHYSTDDVSCNDKWQNSSHDIDVTRNLLVGMFKSLEDDLLANPKAMVPAIQKMTDNFKNCRKNQTKLILGIQKAFSDPLQPIRMPPNIPVQQSSIMRVSSMLCRQLAEKKTTCDVNKVSKTLPKKKRVRFQSPVLDEMETSSFGDNTYII